MPNGTLTKKIQRQPMVSVMRPPSTGPSAGATSVGIITIVDARARSIGGKARNSIAIADRREHPAADPLQDAEGDELADRLGGAARHRADRRTARAR